jgi:hypothetical protein
MNKRIWAKRGGVGHVHGAHGHVCVGLPTLNDRIGRQMHLWAICVDMVLQTGLPR